LETFKKKYEMEFIRLEASDPHAEGGYQKLNGAGSIPSNGHYTGQNLSSISAG